MGFWYLLQETLWNVDFPEVVTPGEDQWAVATALYKELAVVLKRKVTWPSRNELVKWTKGAHFRTSLWYLCLSVRLHIPHQISGICSKCWCFYLNLIKWVFIPLQVSTRRGRHSYKCVCDIGVRVLFYN